MPESGPASSRGALLRRLRHDSRKNKLYRAFRELWQVIRTIVLRPFLLDPEADGAAR